jgi:hypothetical protein
MARLHVHIAAEPPRRLRATDEDPRGVRHAFAVDLDGAVGAVAVEVRRPGDDELLLDVALRGQINCAGGPATLAEKEGTPLPAGGSATDAGSSASVTRPAEAGTGTTSAITTSTTETNHTVLRHICMVDPPRNRHHRRAAGSLAHEPAASAL